MKNLNEKYLHLYRKTLLDDVVPFWMTHAMGSSDGAINNCLDDLGTLVSCDRFLWSQGRALWTFSALYNRIEQRPEWLAAAERIFHYLLTHGRDTEGRWMFRLDDTGRVLETDVSIFVDGFVLNGLGEYYQASKDHRAADLAVETYQNVRHRLNQPGSYNIKPYDIPSGMKNLGVSMIFSAFFFNLGKALGRADICNEGYELALRLLGDFRRPESDYYTEFVTINRTPSDNPIIQVCVPGHVIEAMWFLIDIFEHRGEKKLIDECCRTIRRHIELAWDNQYGGLCLAVNVDGKDDVAWPKADCKPWWVQLEAMVATAYAHRHCGQTWCMDWHEKIRRYAYDHYPVPTGEWTQWLDRFGKKTGTAALPVKDMFHLPRALMVLLDLFGSRTNPFIYNQVTDHLTDLK
ncbi:MAG: AGE family epimerase/isomerase [Phycisphaerae bacterium]